MAKVSKDKRSGKWIVRHVHDGTHHQKSFDLKKHADAYWLRIEGDLASGNYIGKKDVRTVEDVCEEFIRWNEIRMEDGRLTPQSMYNTKNAIDTSIVPNVGAKRMDALTLTDVEQFYRTMCRTLHPATARTRVGTLKRIETFARRRGWTKGNVVADALPDLRGIKAKPVRTFSQAEIMNLLVATAATSRRKWEREHTVLIRQLVINIAVFCGLRYGEIMGLTTPCLDLDRRLIMVRHSLAKTGKLGKPKTDAGVRDVPMPAHVVLMLREWLARFHEPNAENLVLCRSFRGKPCPPPTNPEFHINYWRPTLRAAGLDDQANRFHFHALRHFFASWQLSTGAPLADVAAMMGHSKATTTMQTYAHALAAGARRQSFIDTATERLIGAPTVLEADEIPFPIASNCVPGLKPLILHV